MTFLRPLTDRPARSFGRAFLLLCLFSLPVAAATPPSGTISTPTDDTPGVKQTFTFTGGPLVGGLGFTNISLPACIQAVTPPAECDIFTVNVNLPAGYYATHASSLAVHLTWTGPAGTDPSLNDVDVYIVDKNGSELGRGADSNAAEIGGTGKAEENASAPNLPAGIFRVVIINSASTVVPSYTATVTFSLLTPPTAAPPTAQIFENHVPPLPADGSPRKGKQSLEPTIGVNEKTGNVMYLSGTETFRVTFDDAVTPAKSFWQDVSAGITSIDTLDPILFTDKYTGRTFISQLYAACSLMAFTDDDGATWFQNPIGCGLAAAIDHQTVGGGPWAPGMSSVDPVFNYPNSVFYCAQSVVAAQCGSSINGGITWNPAVPAYNLTQCGGLHGHIRTAPDGTLYLPNANCNAGEQGVVVSEDNGLTWEPRTVPGSTASNSGDPYVDVAPDGTVYFAWSDGNGHMYAAVSRDKGLNWTQPFDIGAAQNVVNSEFPTIVVGDNGRAAAAFLGTSTPGNTQAATFAGDWYMYAAFTYNGGESWTTYNVTPNDPVQRGCVWNGGGSNPCRNLLDFFGITSDAQGRVLIGYADGCIDDPENPANRCVSNPPADITQTIRTRLSVIARQSGGLGLKAEFDGKIFKAAPGIPALSGIAGNLVNHLTWSVPNNNGAAISGYRIYRGTSPGSASLYKSVGNVNAYDDTGVVNGTTYYYQVSAVNAVGEGGRSNEIALTPAFAAAPSAPQRLSAKGRKDSVLLAWSAPSSQGTAAISSYRIYRGTSSGNKTLLATVANNVTKYVDATTAAGTTYYYQVAAVNSVGEGARSNESSAAPK